MRICFAIGLILWAAVAQAREATLLQSLTMTMDNDLFGGLSGIDFVDNGGEFVAVSDRGRFVTGRIDRDAQDRMIGFSDTRLVQIVGPDGLPMRHLESDSEGVAIGPDGTRFVSFETVNTIRLYGTQPWHESQTEPHPDFADLIANGSFEALARDDAGALYTMPERSGTLIKPHVVYRFQDGAWDRFGTISRSLGFLPVGADFGPDGRFYLLERGFNGLGFSARIRRFDKGAEGFENGVTVLTTRTGRHDNLEGIAIWRAVDGLRATMVSDDNFTEFQSTQIVEYALPD